VGLKEMVAPALMRNNVGSNRTIVGLKVRIIILFWVMSSEQQSHHCGIESSKVVWRRRRIQKQQSHHCGIERELEKALCK